MYNVTDDKLCICLRDSEPEQRREYLIQDIAAILRWYASGAEGRYERDDQSLYRLAQLLEALSAIEDEQ